MKLPPRRAAGVNVEVHVTNVAAAASEPALASAPDAVPVPPEKKKRKSQPKKKSATPQTAQTVAPPPSVEPPRPPTDPNIPKPLVPVKRPRLAVPTPRLDAPGSSAAVTETAPVTVTAPRATHESPAPLLTDPDAPLPAEFTEAQFTKVAQAVIAKKNDLVPDLMGAILECFPNFDYTAARLMIESLEKRGVISNSVLGEPRVLLTEWGKSDAPPPIPPPPDVRHKYLRLLGREKGEALLGYLFSGRELNRDTLIGTFGCEVVNAEGTIQDLLSRHIIRDAGSGRYTSNLKPITQKRLKEITEKSEQMASGSPERSEFIFSLSESEFWALFHTPGSVIEEAPGTAATIDKEKEPTGGAADLDNAAEPESGASAAPEPAASEAHSPTTTEIETTTTETKTPLLESITSGFRSAADRFRQGLARFRGEVTAKDEKDYKPTSADVTASIATGVLSVAASYGGVKIIHDLPAWVTQKYLTKQERARLMEAYKPPNGTSVEDTSTGALERRMTKLEEAISASKFLTEEKKRDLILQAKDIHNTLDAGRRQAEEKYQEDIAKLLDQAIQTRIRNAQVLKESLNFAFMTTGLSTLRGVAYGVVALGERAARLKQEKRLGLNTLIVGGVTETLAQLKGGGAETRAGKAISVVHGATVVLRAAGFAELAISEMLTEGVGGAIEASLKAWEEKGTGQFLADNALAPWRRLGSLLGSTRGTDTAPELPVGTTGDTGVSDTDTGGTDTGDSDASPDVSESGEPRQTAAGAGAPPMPGESPEPGTAAEYPETPVETERVQKGDGILKILERQGLSAKAALAAAREAGIVRADGDTRLATQAIGRLAVLAHESDGHTTIGFLDTQTGQEMTLEEARAAGFTYEHGVSAPATEAPNASVPEAAETSTGLVDGSLRLNPVGDSFNIQLDELTPGQVAEVEGMADASAIEMAATGEIAGRQEMTKELSQRLASAQTVLTKLEAKDLGDSAEAHLLRESLAEDLAEAQRTNLFDASDLQKIQAQVNLFHEDAIQAVPAEARIGDIRIPGLGQVAFTYDTDGKPQFDLTQLIKNAKPVLESRAANMLVDGWQETLAADYVSQQEMSIAGEVYLMNEAIRELKAAGQGESVESKFLIEQLGMYLRSHKDVLDGTHAIVKDAAQRAGVYTEIFAKS